MTPRGAARLGHDQRRRAATTRSRTALIARRVLREAVVQGGVGVVRIRKGRHPGPQDATVARSPDRGVRDQASQPMRADYYFADPGNRAVEHTAHLDDGLIEFASPHGP